MGDTQSVNFEPDQEALDGSGEPVVLSNVIEELTPDEFWTNLKDLILHRKAEPKKYELDYKAEVQEDGSIQVSSTQGTQGTLKAVFGEHKVTTYHRVVFDPENDTMYEYEHYYDSTFSKDTATREAVFKIHRDPFRIEHWVNELESRLAGPALREMLLYNMRKVDPECTVMFDQPSAATPGKRCVTTGPLTDQTLTAEDLWQKTVEGWKEQGAEELETGDLIMEKELFGGFTSYTMLCASDDKSLFEVKSFANDETLQNLRCQHVTKVVTDPVRVEFWYEHKPNRSGSKLEAAVATLLIRQVLIWTGKMQPDPAPPDVKEEDIPAEFIEWTKQQQQQQQK